MLSKSEPLAEGTVIMADNQYAGRGQQQNEWHAEPGLNLTVSILLKPSFLLIAQQFMLNIAVSNGIYQALNGVLGHGLTIKWPNDIYYEDRKIGGVLIENNIAGRAIKSSIIGIGLNVNQKNFDPEKVKTASSLSIILQEDVNLMELLGKICCQIEGQYLKLRAGQYDQLKREYSHCLYKLNRLAFFRQNGELLEGKITGVTEEGLLLLAVNGAIRRYNFKEIEFMNDPYTTMK